MGVKERRQALDAFEPGRSTDIRTTREMQWPAPGGAGYAYGDGPQLAPRGPDAEHAPLVRLLYPPRIEKLNVSRDFNVNDFHMTLPAGIGSTVSSTALRFQLPQDQVGWLQQWGLYVLTPTAATTAQWQVRINQGPVAGFDNKENPPGTANFIVLGDDDMRIRIPNGATVDILITNLGAGGPWTLGGFLSGWYHPEIAELRAWGLEI